MTASVLLAPAGAGKTRFLVHLAVNASRDLACPPRVVVANRAQIRAWRHLLAEAGGAMGVRLLTFDDLYVEVLHAAGEHPLRLPDPVQVRVMRALLDATPLDYFSSLRLSPSLPGMLRDLWAELAAAGVDPEAFAAYCTQQPARLNDLAQLYLAYRKRLDQEHWVDYGSLGARAASVLREHPDIGAVWPLLLVDGIDDLTAVQLRVLTMLAARVERLVVTLTGDAVSQARVTCHHRASLTRERLERAFSIRAEPLPDTLGDAGRAPALLHLEQTLHFGDSLKCTPDGAIAMMAVPDREAEVRAALRWLKRRLTDTGVSACQAALLVRDLEPYRAALAQVASEYGLPLSWASRAPLRENPAIAALLGLLRLSFPSDGEAASAFPWRKVVDAWRSPYFDWSACDIAVPDAVRLEWVARWGNVVSGMVQWREAFAALAAIDPAGTTEDGEPIRLPSALPCGPAAEQLQLSFQRFVAMIAPPGTAEKLQRPCSDHVRWLEELIGDTETVIPGDAIAAEPEGDDALEDDSIDSGSTCLGLAWRAAHATEIADPPLTPEQARLAIRDVAALNALKDVLRGLVWAEQALRLPPQTAAQFIDDLLGAIDAATYAEPLPEGESGVFVGSVSQARGLSFGFVALLGLAEGEFPATLREDTLLRDRERMALNVNFGADLRLPTESEESELFYTAITRARRALLLTRPRIADDGALWKPSPFWEEVLRHIDIEPQRLTTRDRPPSDEAASWPELWQVLVTNTDSEATNTRAWASAQRPADAQAIDAGATVLQARLARQGHASANDGNLAAWAATWSARMGPQHRWSVSQLEAYRRCPHSYFAERILGLEPRRAPVEGLDARQRGTLYHRILAAVYQHAGSGAGIEALVESLTQVAEPILDEAPRREGFRVTPWWERTRASMLRNVRDTLVALETSDTRFRFHLAEAGFGRRDDATPPLVVEDAAADTFLLTGIIDRVDMDGGGAVRIVDYKGGGVGAHSAAAVRRGDDLQIPLYALAAEQVLSLGRIAEGFYWSVVQAKASPLKLSTFDLQGQPGPQAATLVAVGRAWEAVRAARSGQFAPVPPVAGCPSYCPAAAYCWSHREARW